MATDASRPENLPRSALHAGAALFALWLLATLPPVRLQAVALSVAAACWGLEWARRRVTSVNAALMGSFGVFAHPHERVGVNSGTWYATGLALLAVGAPSPAAAAAIAVLGFGDPAAGAVGRRWGRTRLGPRRSLEGTMAFAGVGALAAWAALRIGWPEVQGAWVPALAAGIAGACAEVGVRGVDDNLSVPVAAALAVAAVGVQVA
ncbi:MAG: hypothetical protein RLZZ299_2719 [Pseudomonadota bacterium]|jgi:dolichol kinase